MMVPALSVLVPFDDAEESTELTVPKRWGMGGTGGTGDGAAPKMLEAVEPERIRGRRMEEGSPSPRILCFLLTDPAFPSDKGPELNAPASKLLPENLLTVSSFSFSFFETLLDFFSSPPSFGFFLSLTVFSFSFFGISSALP